MFISRPASQENDTLKRRLEIEEDFKTDREEFYQESNKEDLLQTLHEEYRKSAKGKWNFLQKLFALGHFTAQQNSSRPDGQLKFRPTHHGKGNGHVTVIDTDHDDELSNMTSDHRRENGYVTVIGANRNEGFNHVSFDPRQGTTSPPGNKRTVITVNYSKSQEQQNGFHSSIFQKVDIPVQPVKSASKVKFSTG